MNTWEKMFCTQASLPIVTLVRVLATVTLTIILLGSKALPQTDSAGLGISAHDLARKVITNELKSQDKDHGHWMYRLEKEEFGKKQIEEIVETNDGSLSRLLSVDWAARSALPNRSFTRLACSCVISCAGQRLAVAISEPKLPLPAFGRANLEWPLR